MTNYNPELFIGYDLRQWRCFGEKHAINIPIAPPLNSSGLICGMSGSGKSYTVLSLLGRLASLLPNEELYFCDYKQDPDFTFMRECSHYFAYTEVLDALNITYDIMHQRMLGQTTDFHPVSLIFDEYVAFTLALQDKNKTLAKEVMNKVSEILMLGRSLSVRIWVVCQRPDSMVFPLGSRLNFGFIIILGAPSNSIYEMLIPDHIDQIQGMSFQTGEGILLNQAKGSTLDFIKIPMVRNKGKLQELCIKALS